MEGRAPAAAAIKVVSSPPLRAVMRELGPQFERATGHTLDIRIDAVACLKRQIDEGGLFDVALLTPALVDALILEGGIAPGSRTDIARAGLGVAVRSGGRRLDVGTAAAMKRALLDASSVMYASGSAVMAHIERMFERLGIAGDMLTKRKLLPAGGHIGTAIADGAAELGLTIIPVILETGGVELAGPFPAGLQFHVGLSGGVSTRSPRPEEAAALLRYLTASEAAAAIEAKGLERFSS